MPNPTHEIRNRSAMLTVGGSVEARLVGRYALIDDVAKHQQGALVTMRGRCATIQAIVQRRHLESLPETRTMSGYGTNCGGVVPGIDLQVPAGTRVYWRDGRPAGWTRKRSTLHAHARTDLGELACFPKSPSRFGCGSQRLELCVRRDRLTIIPARR